MLLDLLINHDLYLLIRAVTVDALINALMR